MHVNQRELKCTKAIYTVQSMGSAQAYIEIVTIHSTLTWQYVSRQYVTVKQDLTEVSTEQYRKTFLSIVPRNL